MTLRIEYEDLEHRGMDAGGGDILYHCGQPFTGIVVLYADGVLISEEEFTDGHLGGAQRQYHLNGQIEEEYFIALNTHYGLYRKWDQEGNVVKQFVLGPKPSL
jgi:antitoxin component YwqK of YwqJK toxin-antitoxin module